MNLTILSDVHGSAENLQKALDASRDKLSSSTLVLLGDIYNHGPRNPLPEGYAPMQVAKILNAKKDDIIAVKGNCDSEVDEMISEFKFVAGCYLEEDGKRIYLTHGHKCNADFPNEQLRAGDVVLYGHFHRPSVKDVDGVKYVCVGAVGMSPEGVEKTFATIENDKLTIWTLEGELVEETEI